MPKSKSPRLLVADDDLGVIAAYRLVLENNPYGSAAGPRFDLGGLEEELFGAQEPDIAPWRVDFVDQGTDAVTAVQSAIEAGDPYKAVFLDVRMPPGLDGYETAELIRKLDADIHIVFVSGYSDYHPIDLVEVGGGDGKTTVMPKPVWPDQLREIAAMVTSHHKSAA